jgi:hypothetical protein
MCFEFEALYWAKMAEEEDKRQAAEQQRMAQVAKAPHQQPAHDHDKDALPA